MDASRLHYLDTNSVFGTINFGSFGSTFSHTDSSCVGFSPVRFRWLHNQIPDSNIVVYMDLDFLGGLRFQSRYRYLWLTESREIVPRAYNFVRENHAKLKNVYRKIFTHDASLLALSQLFCYVPNGSNSFWIRDFKKVKKTELLSFIDSGKRNTSGHQLRDLLYSITLRHHPTVKTFGQRFSKPFKAKEEALKPFMFSLVIENSIYDCYFTEKLLDCFATRVVPIYFGSMNVDLIFNSAGILRCSVEKFEELCRNISADLYWSLQDAVEENFFRVLNHKRADDWVYDRIYEDLRFTDPNPFQTP
jgi:hypothetical protein